MKLRTVSSITLRLKNFASSFFLLTAVYGFYSHVHYFKTSLRRHHKFLSFDFTVADYLLGFYLVYSLLLFFFYLIEPHPQRSKSWYCLGAIKQFVTDPLGVWRLGLNPEFKAGLLATAVKAFFAPLMVVWLLDHTLQTIENGVHFFRGVPSLLTTDFLALFNVYGYWFLFKLILFADVFFFTVGYLIELPILKNEIRSVEPTLLGWAVALACYPPFNSIMAFFLVWQPQDFPHFNDPLIHIALNVLLLMLMGIYSSASVVLNFKASNLTHRGIVSQGPYAIVRHPAYICKNLAWWIGSIPAVSLAAKNSWLSACYVLLSVGGWTFIYALRALTEERHLRQVDGEYDRYCEKVRYRFIPWII